MEQTPAQHWPNANWMQRSIMADRQEWLRWLAEQTGGFAIVNQNDINAGIGRIVDDTRGYYLIGFDTRWRPACDRIPPT